MLFVFVLFFISCNSTITKVSSSDIKTTDLRCTANFDCKEFFTEEEKCRRSGDRLECEKFVDRYKRLVEKTDCKRSFDTKTVPAIWLCDETYPGVQERSASTLSKLKFDFADRFYNSKEFRLTLDGALAEEHSEQNE